MGSRGSSSWDKQGPAHHALAWGGCDLTCPRQIKFPKFYKKESSCHGISSKKNIYIYMASFGFRANKSSLNSTSACYRWNNNSSLCALWTKKAQPPTKCCYKPPAGKSHRSSSPGPQTLPFLIVSSDSSSSLKYKSASMAPSLLCFPSLEQFWACGQCGHSTARGCRKRHGFGAVNSPGGTPSICAGVLDLSQAKEMPRASADEQQL